MARARARVWKRRQPHADGKAPVVRARSKRAKTTPVDERTRLAEALAASPDDRELQSIYADALIELGGDHALRGELIQLSLAKSVKTAKRKGELISAIEAARARGIGKLESEGGFVRAWTCRADVLVAHAEAIFGDEPLLDRVTITFPARDAVKLLAQLAELPSLARIRELALIGHATRAGRPGAQGLAALFGSPYFPRLRVLRIPNCTIGDAGAKLLAAQPSLCELEELELTQNDIFSKGTIALAGSPHLGQLRRLVLRGNKPGQAGFQAIATTKTMTRLAYLDSAFTWSSGEWTRPIQERFPDIEIQRNR